MNSKLQPLIRLFFVFALIATLSSCQHRVNSMLRREAPFDGSNQTGYASWYGDQFHGRKTSSGEIYDMYSMTAAHRSAPFGTNVRVTNLDNGKQTVVKVNDRGPFVRGRIIDLSKKAAQEIGMIGTGTAKVKLEFLDRKPIVTAAKPVSSGTTYIQTGSFESESNAQTHILHIQQAGLSVTPRIYREKGLYRVRFGPYQTDDDAQSDLNRLKRSSLDGFILHTN